MFKIGDSVYAVQNIGFVKENQVGTVVDVLEDYLPFPYIVDFGAEDMPCKEKEIALD